MLAVGARLILPEDEKRLEAWAKQKGFVSKDEFQSERQKIQQDSIKNVETQAVNQFLENILTAEEFFGISSNCKP